MHGVALSILQKTHIGGWAAQSNTVSNRFNMFLCVQIENPQMAQFQLGHVFRTKPNVQLTYFALCCLKSAFCDPMSEPFISFLWGACIESNFKMVELNPGSMQKDKRIILNHTSDMKSSPARKGFFKKYQKVFVTCWILISEYHEKIIYNTLAGVGTGSRL